MKMLGKMLHPPCGRHCCASMRTTRNLKRSERQAWKKEVR